MEKHNMILAAEEQLAREVILGRIVKRPMAVWSYLIPGMFIIDYLRRGSAIRLYTKHFMFSLSQIVVDWGCHLALPPSN